MSCECDCSSEEEITEAAFEVCESCKTASKCEKAGYCKKSKAEAEETCGVGEEMIDGECRKIAVTLELDINESKAIVSADTGNTIIEISGVAFHEGMNKNKWSLTPEGALSVAQQMEGSDLTLFHPKADESGSGFTRNTDGDLE